MFWIPKQRSFGAQKYFQTFQFDFGKSAARQRLPDSITATR